MEGMVEEEEEEARDEAAEVGGTPKLVKTAHKEGDGPKPAFDSGTAGSSPSINGGSVSAGRMGRIAARKAGKYYFFFSFFLASLSQASVLVLLRAPLYL